MAYGAYHPRNPRGQQRDKLYREALRLVLCEDPDEPFPPVTEADGPMKRLRGIARVHVKKAEEGDMQAIKELADRLDGKPAQMLEHVGGGEMRVIVTSGLVREQQIVDADYQEAETVPTKLIGTET